MWRSNKEDGSDDDLMASQTSKNAIMAHGPPVNTLHCFAKNSYLYNDFSK